MITHQQYNRMLAELSKNITKAWIYNQDAVDLEVINNIVIESCRKGLELALQFKGQEEAERDERINREIEAI